MAENALVPLRGDISAPGPRAERRACIDEEDAVPRPAVEIVSDKELRYEEQVKPKAKAPETFFKKAPEGVPKFPGAEVSCETLLGFLAAAELILPEGANTPILSSSKVTYRGGDASRLYLESSSLDIWTLVAIEARPSSSAGFIAMMPLRHAKNAVNAMRLNYKSVAVGLNDDKLCLGPTLVPYGGRVEDFPEQPVLRDWEARAAMPSFYAKEICSRVMPAQSRSEDPKDEELKGVLLDFDVVEFEGHPRVLCTAVATDAGRMHILQLPRMQVQLKDDSVLPPAVIIPDRLFRYLEAVGNGEWAALELSESQVIGRGEDYIAVANATMRGKGVRSVMNWREVDIDHPGYWTADRGELERLAQAALESSRDGSVRLKIDAMVERLELTAWGDGNKFKDWVPVRRFDGPPAVHVQINGRYLLQAISACQSGLIRLSFSHELDDQDQTGMVLRGEDEQFKAIVMPIN